MSATQLCPRGSSVCRGCGAGDLRSILDLGCQPLANSLLTRREAPDPVYPLHLKICPACGLGQVGEFATPWDIFHDYPYLSSMSASWLQHVGRYAAQMCSELTLGPEDLVVEIASNDGHLLKAFQQRGIRVLGIEPAANVAAIARAHGVPTVNEFFGAAMAESVVRQHGRPSLVVANNVMAHVPDLVDFTTGLGRLCGPDTVVTIENPSLLALLHEAQFDTIYHEHFSYLTAHAVNVAVRGCGLDLVRVETLPTHGGSNRYWLRRAGSCAVDDSVVRIMAAEVEGGLFDHGTWGRFAAAAQQAIEGLRSWLAGRVGDGRRVAVYGAAAKGNTFLNAAGIAGTSVSFAVDASPEKQGRYMPGSRIPVFAPDRLARDGVDDVVVLPWNLADEIAPLVRDLSPRSSIWVALPEMREIT